MNTLHVVPIGLAAAILSFTLSSRAQIAPQSDPAASLPEQQQPTPEKGQILFSRDATYASTAAQSQEAPPEFPAKVTPQITEAERESPTITAYDLDVHLTPAASALASRTRLTIRNDGKIPVTRLVLQISSTLRWESFTGSATGAPILRLPFAQQTVETDADHTGFVSEAVVTLPEPLAPGATYQLATLYSGALSHSSARLDRIGAPADQARLADWDEIGPETTALRGFGEVLWYPVAAVPVFLGDGARFFQEVGRVRFRARNTPASLRLAVEYVGEAPHSAYFGGRVDRLTAHSENQDVPVAESPGVATAEFPPRPLGFHALSLFVTEKPETIDDTGLLSAVTEDDPAFHDYAAAAALVQPMLAEWFGTSGPAQPLRLIDHRGQPFEDAALLVTPMAPANPKTLAPRMAEALSHAWMPSSEPWIEDGLAQFFYLLWTERTSGRAAALHELQRAAAALALAEPQPDPAASLGSPTSGQTLIDAHDEVFYRAKAAAVWWMLRDLVGDDALKLALQHLRQQSRTSPESAASTRRLQQTLEQRTGTPLAWFFNDWIYADKGLPDLSIIQVIPRELPTKNGKISGWLVAVEVKNEGDAVAEVPVTVRSGTLTTTERLRIPGRASASTRILFQTNPEEVLVNDGSVPEVRTSQHTRKMTVELHDPPPN